MSQRRDDSLRWADSHGPEPMAPRPGMPQRFGPVRAPSGYEEPNGSEKLGWMAGEAVIFGLHVVPIAILGLAAASVIYILEKLT